MKNIDNIRHSLAHLLGASVMDLYPDTKRTIGPAIENGFYFDFDFGDVKITDADLPLIESRMRELLPTWTDTACIHLSKEKALAEYPKNEFKHELINEFSPNGQELSFYKNGKYWDLCKGGHSDSPASEIDPQSFKLDKLAGAYWRGDAKNKQLTRIYGLAFLTKEELEKYIWQQEEAKKRDHRILGKQLKLYTISDLVGPGLPMFQKNGNILRREITDYLWDLHKSYNYEWVWTPHLAKEALYEKSGHAGSYMEDMFSVFGGSSKEKFFVKPMSCPHHMQLFDDNQFSYRDMPVRYFEPATIYRDEKTGQLNGLARVRSITQDDGHIFCRVDGIQTEIKIMIEIISKFYKTFGMDKDYKVRLSLRDDRANTWLGTDEVWAKAEKALRDVCISENLPYFEGPGEAAFYGPKLDFMFNDAIGRPWQLATIQCDFNQPDRFNLSFINEKGEKEQPVVIHRAISGSLERFLGVAIEHFAGAFPVWLSPVQVSIVPVKGEFHGEYAKKVYEALKEKNIRVELDDRNESLGKRIRSAKEFKTPYVIVIGDKERDSGNLTIETRKDKIENISIDEFVNKLTEEIKNRTLN